ncbi:fatty acid desaturase family protein [Parerythrobacter lacustris]|uniref:Fatty acid desaturase n=1 Tax=Parerythrobacter lacustris TaxID=2969984 RepID=A0ABT1XN97_9SPHN|nr:fatty acid desaturase [Parerythrobacter lacustris]MCR2832739.1 fatty acid desaturase [Parerythrobacter lacustris]
MEKTLDPAISVPAAAPRASREQFRASDDKVMLRLARDLTKDIADANPSIYWPDMLLSAGIGYAAMAGAILVSSVPMAIALGLISALALYRALMFIHELTHIHRNALPGFRLAWNVLVGIPMLVPSYMYEGVHTIHHKRTQYGTIEDPEYLPLALMKPWSLPLFVLVALLAPVAFLLRCAILLPLGAAIPPIRRLTWERFSALSINPDFRRRPPEGEMKGRVFWQEFGGFVWSWALIGSVFAFGWRPLLIALAIVSFTAVLNQLRTLVAHLWENEGEPMTVTAQFLDSVNVPPPGFAAELWAPVGLRYHALHHLMPSMPYHALPEAHRRLKGELGNASTYDGANHPGMLHLVGRIARSTMAVR